MSGLDQSIHYDEHGLVPAIIQDWRSGEVLMLAYMNAEALELTLKTGETHFWSRSRGELWHKGSTSGNVQHVKDVLIDCDQDAILVTVEPAGPACHTGKRSCFYRHFTGTSGEFSPVSHSTEAFTGEKSEFSLDELYEIIRDRQVNPPPNSYTAQLFSMGEDEIVKKVGEEAVEVIVATKSQGDQRLVEEVADLAYHVLVLLAWRGLSPTDINNELAQRHRSK